MRNVLNFNAGWFFAKQSEIPAAMPADWEKVDLPHSWNSVDGQDGGNDYFRGTACYAKTFAKAELPQSDRYYLELQGANSSADVYLNGVKLAHHDGGYSTWRVDMTETLQEENLLVVAVDNAANETVYPQMADFTFYGGLYRDVNIVCVSESHFDLDYFGGKGVMVTPTVNGADASVEVQVWVTNAAEGQKLRYTLYDAAENALQTIESDESKVSFTIENVHLWHGRKDPYLYCMEVELVSGDEVIDNVCTRFGCRTFKIDAERGFILNGEEYPLRGVSRHQDRWGKGNALSHADHEEDMDLICEVGATTIRLAHYQHDQYFYDLCDERGMVIWAEIPYISKHMPT
ncbi:MAG: glycoside hydrolase family 2 protein, partial [Oscillospiraceae bacterium]|nr:glycoside hydrolase family 2 protein [Oscillospiraceae bacterium]